MVKLVDVKQGDKVIHRDGTYHIVHDLNIMHAMLYPVEITFDNGRWEEYTYDGRYYKGAETDEDIVTIVPQHSCTQHSIQKEPNDGEMAELDRLNNQALRDQFAMSALTGLLANDQTVPQSFSFDASSVAEKSYFIADKMMKVRKKNNEQ